LDDVFDILCKFDRSVLQDTNTDLAALVDNHSTFSSKLFDRVAVLDRFLLTSRKVAVLRKGAKLVSTYPNQEPEDIAHEPSDALDVFDFSSEQRLLSQQEEETHKASIANFLSQKSLPPLLSASVGENIADFGAFFHNQQIGTVKSSSKLTSVDTFALIEDVLYANFIELVRGKNFKCYNFDAIYSEDRIQWKRISGSSDPLVVMAYIELDHANMQFKVHVKIVNASGMKIPGFELSVVTSGYMSPMESYCALGEDYFLPNAIFLRSFTFLIATFDNTSVIIRIHYPDLVKDPVDFIPFPLMSGGKGRQSDSQMQSQSHHSRHQETFTAIVPCADLSFPAYALLVPYGSSSLSSMRMLYEPNSGGIPKAVFAALFCRLQHSTVFEVASFFDLGDSAYFALCHVLEARSSLPLKGAYEIQFPSLVDGTDSDSKVGIEVLCWALQTLWGQEIAIRLNLFKETSSSNPPVGMISMPLASSIEDIHFPRATWRGCIEIRSSSPAVLGTLREDDDGYCLIFPLDV